MLSARGPSVTICKINNVNLKHYQLKRHCKFEIAAAGTGNWLASKKCGVRTARVRACASVCGRRRKTLSLDES